MEEPFNANKNRMPGQKRPKSSMMGSELTVVVVSRHISMWFRLAWLAAAFHAVDGLVLRLLSLERQG